MSLFPCPLQARQNAKIMCNLNPAMLAFRREAFGRQAAQDGGSLMLLYWGKHPQKPLDEDQLFSMPSRGLRCRSFEMLGSLFG